MDPAYVVALAVLADERVVLTDHADPMGARLTGAARATGRPDRRQRHDSRRDHHLAGRHELPVQLDQPERVGGADGQRPGREPAPHSAEKRILHHPTPALVGLVDQESRPAAQFAWHHILQQQDRSREPAVLTQNDLTLHRRSERHLGRLDQPLTRHPEAGPRHENHCNHRKSGEQQSEPHHVALTGDHRDQHHGDAGDQKDPASCGEQSPGFPHLRSGMCTDWIAWAMMSVTVRRAS